MKFLSTGILALTCLCPALLAGQARPAAKPPEPVRAAIPVQPPRSTSPPDSDGRARTVQYTSKDVIRIKTQVRFTTLIVLPGNEQILDFICGDKEFWVVNGTQNFAYVKPAKEGAQTNLNLVTASGNVYSFLLAEVSGLNAGEPDLKLFLETKDESILSSAAGSPKFVSSQVVDDFRRQVELAKEETRQVKSATQATIDRGFSQFVSSLRFTYRFEAEKKPFSVQTIFNDGRYR